MNKNVPGSFLKLIFSSGLPFAECVTYSLIPCLIQEIPLCSTGRQRTSDRFVKFFIFLKRGDPVLLSPFRVLSARALSADRSLRVWCSCIRRGRLTWLLLADLRRSFPSAFAYWPLSRSGCILLFGL